MLIKKSTVAFASLHSVWKGVRTNHNWRHANLNNFLTPPTRQFLTIYLCHKIIRHLFWHQCRRALIFLDLLKMRTLRKQRSNLLHRQVIVGFLAIGIGIVKTSGFSDYDDFYRGNNCVTHDSNSTERYVRKFGRSSGAI